MNQMNLIFTRADEPPAFNIAGYTILDPVGPIKVALREGAMEGGNPSITMVIPLKNGMSCVVETTYRLWDMAARGMKGAIERWAKTPLGGSKGEQGQAANDALLRMAEVPGIIDNLGKVDVARVMGAFTTLGSLPGAQEAIQGSDAIYVGYVCGLLERLQKAMAP